MNKFFSVSFLLVLGGYLLLILTVGYVGVYIHYFAIPLILTLLFLAFITRPGLIFGSKRVRRTIADDDYGAFDFVMDCGGCIWVLLKFPFAVAKYIRDDYREYKTSQAKSSKD